MKNERNNERLLESIEYIDADIVDAVMAKLEPKKTLQKTVNKGLRAAAILAACVALIALALPMAVGLLGEGDITSTSIIEQTAATPAADNTTEEVETAPVYDGSRGLIYEVNEDGKSASLVDFHLCEDEVMVVASHYNGLPVTEIRNKNFNDSNNYGNKKVKHLVISDTVKSVFYHVISEMENLESIYIGADVEIIRFGFDGTFNYKLSSFEVSPENKVFTVKNNCLVDIEKKTLVQGCLTSVIPDDGSVEIIGNRAFTNFPIESIEIPEGIKIIERWAFAHCHNLKRVVLPKSLEQMGDVAFMQCDELESLDLNGFTYLPQNALTWSSALKELKGSENLVSIGENALSHCNSLGRIKLGTCLEKIEVSAFSFYRYSNAIIIDYAGTEAEWNAVEKILDWNYRSDNLTVNCTDATLKPEAYMDGGGPRDPETVQSQD